MPEIIACPDCGRKLRVPDDLIGRQVKCPSCGVQFTASVVGGGTPPLPINVGTGPLEDSPRNDPPPLRRNDDDDYPRRRRPRDDEDDYPRRRRPQDDDDDYPRRLRVDDDDDDSGESPRALFERWKKVRLGITFVIVSIWVILGGVAFFCLSGVFLAGMTLNAFSQRSATGLTGGSTALRALIFFVYLVLLASMGFKVTGHGFGMAVPTKRNNPVRGLGIATFILALSHAAASLFGAVLSLITDLDFQSNRSFPAALFFNTSGGLSGLLTSLLTIATFVVYLFYLRCLCFAARKERMASGVTTFMIVVGACLLVLVMALFAIGMSVENMLTGLSGDPNFSRGSRVSQNVANNLGSGFCLTPFVSGGLFIWYIVLLHQVRGAIDSYMHRL